MSFTNRNKPDNSHNPYSRAGYNQYSRQGHSQFSRQGMSPTPKKGAAALTAQDWVVRVLYVLNILAVVTFLVLLLINSLLPVHLRIIYLVVIAAVEIGLGFAVWRRQSHVAITVVLSVVMTLFTVGHAAASFYLKSGMDALNAITSSANDDMEFVQFSLVVQKGSPIKDLNQAAQAQSLVAGTQDKELAQQFLTSLASEERVNLNLVNCENYPNGANEILKDPNKVLVLNEAYRGPLDEVVEGFTEKTEVIFTKGIYVPKSMVTPAKIDPPKNALPMAEGSFNIFVSGIDSFGKLATVSRSDVNMVLSVNPTTKTILITSVPRDAYVPIAGGGHNKMDKLTHSGIYGIESSKATMEHLFNIKIDYYARVNFTSLIQMVDVLGGIDVDNPVAFKSKISQYSYDKGMIHLNGDEALYFARERKNLASGDFDRGRNHQRIIAAMINKMMSPKILTNYTQVLGVLMESTQTNMPKETIINILNRQIGDPSPWKIETANITGYGVRGLPSAAMPGYNLYMMKVNQQSVNEAHAKMDEVLNGTATGAAAPQVPGADNGPAKNQAAGGAGAPAQGQAGQTAPPAPAPAPAPATN